MHVDPNSPAATLTRRQQEVLERLELGYGAKQIATDIGISRNAVYQTIERLRRRGALPETYTPSGQPPRRTGPQPAAGAEPVLAPRDSALGALRERSSEGAEKAGYASLIEGAIAANDVAALAYELGRLEARGEAGLAGELVISALTRLGVIPESAPDRKPT